MAERGKALHWGKSGRIVDELRGRIVRGDWAPGARLPNRAELRQQFATTPATIQRALDVLSQENLVVARGRNGTYVTDRLPHRHRLGVVYPFAPTEPQKWHRMYAVVDEEARRLVHEGRYDLRLYYGTADRNAPGFRQLMDDLAADRLAGVFVMGMSLGFFEGTPLLGHPYLRVAATDREKRPGVLPIPSESFIPPAVQRLHAEGRRRVGLVYVPSASEMPNTLQSELAKHGMTGHLHWCIPDWPNFGRMSRTGAYLLARLPRGERPDALIVADDYLAEAATQGLREGGVRVPEDITVLVRCNFPYLPPAVTPIIRLGYDFADLLDRVLEALLANEPPASIAQPCISEEAWRATHPADLVPPVIPLAEQHPRVKELT